MESISDSNPTRRNESILVGCFVSVASMDSNCCYSIIKKHPNEWQHRGKYQGSTDWNFCCLAILLCVLPSDFLISTRRTAMTTSHYRLHKEYETRKQKGSAKAEAKIKYNQPYLPFSISSSSSLSSFINLINDIIILEWRRRQPMAATVRPRDSETGELSPEFQSNIILGCSHFEDTAFFHPVPLPTGAAIVPVRCASWKDIITAPVCCTG